MSRPDRACTMRLTPKLLIFLLFAGCGTSHSGTPPAADLPQARAMFVTGYENIESVYIEPVDFGRLAVAGLERLSEIDPRLGVARERSTVALLVDGSPQEVFQAPAGNGAVGWGALTAEALRAARDASPKLRAAPSEEIYETMFAGVTGELDDYSRYAGTEVALEHRASREGFGGIGVRISVEEELVRIVSVMNDTPAERAGLKADDLVTHIDGEPAAGLKQEDVVRRLRGPVNSKVALTVEREGEAAPLALEVVRAHVVPETVTYRREGDIGYFRVYSFNLETGESLRKEIARAEKEIGDLRGLVLDLRGNPGGLLDEAVEVTDLFLDRGRIVSTHGRHPDSHQYFEASDGDIGRGRPMVILINGNSASAAEIVAAALQDSGRAVVVGSNSYGKGTVQTVLRMPNQGELTLTWARFHAPSGYTLNRLGVLPSICTIAEKADAGPILVALRSGKIMPLPTGTRNAANPNDEAALERLRAGCPVRRGEEAVDLEVALRLLEDPALYARALHLADPPGLAASAAASLPQAEP